MPEIIASQDCYIQSASPTANDNGVQLEMADSGIAAGTERAILEFSMSTLSGTINAISLVLKWTAKTGSPGGKYLTAYKCTRTDWLEAQATWNIYKTANNWTTPGGDFEASSPTPATALIPAWTGSLQSITFDDANFIALVQDAIDNTIDLHLVIRIDDDTGSDGDQVVVGSSEQVDPYKPTLIIPSVAYGYSRGFIIG